MCICCVTSLSLHLVYPQRDKWLDKSSRALEVTFTVYNGNYQLFTSITLQFKMFATGCVPPRAWSVVRCRIALLKSFR